MCNPICRFNRVTVRTPIQLETQGSSVVHHAHSVEEHDKYRAPEVMDDKADVGGAGVLRRRQHSGSVGSRLLDSVGVWVRELKPLKTARFGANSR